VCVIGSDERDRGRLESRVRRQENHRGELHQEILHVRERVPGRRHRRDGPEQNAAAGREISAPSERRESRGRRVFPERRTCTI